MSLRSDERGGNTWRAVESQWKRTFQGGNCPIRLEFPGAQEAVGGCQIVGLVGGAVQRCRLRQHGFLGLVNHSSILQLAGSIKLRTQTKKLLS